jgi:hypothetical protein
MWKEICSPHSPFCIHKPAVPALTMTKVLSLMLFTSLLARSSNALQYEQYVKATKARRIKPTVVYLVHGSITSKYGR